MGFFRPLFSKIDDLWRSRADGLAKYIVLYASLLHIAWAGLLVYSPHAGDSTPIHIMTQVFGGRFRTAVVLVAVAITALGYVFDRHGFKAKTMSILLIPQQLVLFMSAGAGIYASSIARYADGIQRPWPFILADQLPVILVALLYTLAIIEIAYTKENGAHS